MFYTGLQLLFTSVSCCQGRFIEMEGLHFSRLFEENEEQSVSLRWSNEAGAPKLSVIWL